MTKKGKGVMMFVDTNEDISSEQADVIMKIWQTSLQNNHIIAERYPVFFDVTLSNNNDLLF